MATAQRAAGYLRFLFPALAPASEFCGGSGRTGDKRIRSASWPTAGGLSPWESHLTFTVNEANQISDMSFNVIEWDTKILPFNTQFFSWLTEAHPEVAAQMGFPPMGFGFNAENAETALQYLDEFLAQSDDYPINP